MLGMKTDGKNEKGLSYVENAVYERDSEHKIIQMEPGNQFSFSLTLPLISAFPIDGNRVILFSGDGVNSEIGVQEDDSYETIINHPDLNFNKLYPVRGFYKIRQGCEVNVYFNDFYNTDRILNLNKLGDYKDEFDNWDISKLAWQQDISLPSITISKRDGGLSEGKYAFGFELLDSNLNTLSYTPISQWYDVLESNGFDLFLNNIDPKVYFVRIYSVQYITNSFATSTFLVSGELQVINNQLQYTYSSSSQNVNREDLSKLLIKPIKYYNSRHIAQVDQRVIRANLKEKGKQFNDYQKAASKIRTYFRLSDTEVSLPHDEILDVGIVYVHKDGTISPKFHVPNVTSSDFEVIDNFDRQAILNYYNPENSTSNWEVIYKLNGNTFIKTGQGSPFNNSFSFPIVDYYSTDLFILISVTVTAGSTSLTGQVNISNLTPIGNPSTPNTIINTWSEDLRHIISEEDFNLSSFTIPYWKVYNTSSLINSNLGLFGYYEGSSKYRTPPNYCKGDFWGEDYKGRKLLDSNYRYFRVPCKSLTQGKSVGFQFDNIEYPSDDIVGHYFVYSSAETVVDEGVSFSMRDGNTFGYFYNTESSKNQVIFSPKVSETNQKISYDYIKINGTLTPSNKYVYRQEYNKKTLLGIQVDEKDFYISSRVREFTFNGLPNQFRKPETVKTYQPGYTKEIVNLSLSSFIHVAKLYTSYAGVHHITLKKYKPSIDFTNGTYYSLTTNYLTGNSNYIEGQGTYAIEFRTASSTIAQIKESIWDDIGKALLIAVAVAITVVTAGVGAVGVSAGLGAILAAGATTAAGLGAIIGGYFGVQTSLIKATLDGIRSGLYSKYLKDSDFSPSGEFGTGFQINANELMILNLHSQYQKRIDGDFECGEYFDGDYLSEQEVSDYFYSKTAYYDDEDQYHKVRPIFCPELYLYNHDLSYKYPLQTYTALPFTYNYCSDCINLYPNTIIWSEKSFPESISDGSRVFLNENYTIVGENTGFISGLHYDKNRILVRTEKSRFQLAPNPQVLNTDLDTAYLGTGDFLSIPPNEMVATNYGFAGGQGFLDEINTEMGLFSVDVKAGRIFLFTSNGIEELSSEKYGNSDFFYKNITSQDNERAIQLSYDPYWKRVLLFHRDKQYTLSFKNEWVSFHTWTTSFAYNDRNRLYSSLGNQIWKHSLYGNYTNYYGIKQDYVIELNTYNQRTTDLDVIYYYAETIDQEQYQIPFPTFDRAWCYTKQQSSGLLLLTPEDNQYGLKTWDNKEKIVTCSHKDYRINGIRDISTDPRVFTLGVLNKQPINVDYLRPQWYLLPLTDKQFYVRLYAKPKQDVNIKLNVIDTLNFLNEL